MPKSKKAPEQGDIQIAKVDQVVSSVYVVGESPLILNRLAEKARRQLLYPEGRKNAAQKQTSMKHNPLEEFRSSAHKLPEGATLLALPGAAFKRALASAALDIPGAKKAQVGRLTYIANEYVSVYGLPELYMTIVRSADMNKTPDVRTRCVIKKWAATFEVTFVAPIFSLGAIINLIDASGIYIGVGDGRPEKGALSFGRFRTVAPNDKEYLDIVKHGARPDQVAAMESPSFYDSETEELYDWFVDEKLKREYRPNPKLKEIA